MINAVTRGFFAETTLSNLSFSKTAEEDDEKMQEEVKQRIGRLFSGSDRMQSSRGSDLLQRLKRKGFSGLYTPERVGAFMGGNSEIGRDLMSHGARWLPNNVPAPMKNLFEHDLDIAEAKRNVKGSRPGLFSRALGAIKGTTAPAGAMAGAGLSGLLSGFGVGMGTDGKSDEKSTFISRNKGLLGIGAGLVGAHLLSKYMDNSKKQRAPMWPGQQQAMGQHPGISSGGAH